MTTLAELLVEIGADTTEFDQQFKKMEQQLKGSESNVREMAKSTGESAREMSQNWKYMSDEMKQAFKDAQNKMAPFKKQAQEMEYAFFKMGQGMKDYGGTTKQFMGDLEEMGKKQKKINDEMMKNNELLKGNFIQGVATMLTRSTQSEKIAQNFSRMGNPLYTVNNGLLKVTQGLEKMAAAGSPAVLALRMLGPNANMKELNDMTRMITAGIMRMTMVAGAAGIANVMMFKALHGAATETVAGYEQAFKGMLSSVREAFQPMVEVFGAVMIKIYGFIQAIADLAIKFNEAHPVLAKVIQGFLMLIPVLTLILSPLAIGVGLFAGMQAALNSVWMLIGPLITGLGAMMGTVLLVAAAIAIVVAAIILLWNNSEGFKNAVITGWAMIQTAAVAVWNAIVVALQAAWEILKTSGNEAIGTIKDWWAKNGDEILNKASTIWNAIVGVITAVTEVIKSVIMVFVSGIKSFWDKNHEEIQSTASRIWNAISTLVKTVFTTIKNAITSALNVVVPFISEQLGQIQKFWEQNGTRITNVAQTAWKTIQTAIELVIDIVGPLIAGFLDAIGVGFQAVFPVIQVLVQTVWGVIETVISTTIKVVTGIIKTFLSIFEGDWKQAFTDAKGVANDIWHGIEGIFKAIDLGAIGKAIIQGLINGMKSMASSVLNTAKEIANNVKNTIQDAFDVNSPSKFTTWIGEMNGEGLIDGMDNSIAGVERAAKTLSMAGINGLQKSMNKMLSVPSIDNANNVPVNSGGDVYHVTVALNPSDLEEMQNVYDFFGRLKQTNRARG